MATKSELESRISGIILDALDAGVVPWRKDWDALAIDGNRQQNLRGNAYRGINTVITETVSMLEGYEDSRWVTFKQAIDAGGHVRKGEKGTPVILWKPMTKEDEDGETRSFFLMRSFTIFNVSQCDNLDIKPLEVKEGHDWDAIQAAEDIVNGYAGPKIIEQHHADNAPPFYLPATDTISMPLREQFERGDSFYSTLFHEMTHSSGHESRLNRGEMNQDFHKANSRGREELVAEFGAAFLSGHAGLDNSLNGQSASYIDSWRKAIRADRTLVVNSAQRAQKATDLILGQGN